MGLGGDDTWIPRVHPEYPLAANAFEVKDPPGTLTPNVADGCWLMLAPLSVGKHTIRSKAVFTGGFFEGEVIEATTYLTVVP